MPDPEDKIDLSHIKASYYDSSTTSSLRYIRMDALFAWIAELYRQGNEIGWETKILDPLHDRLVAVKEYKKP